MTGEHAMTVLEMLRGRRQQAVALSMDGIAAAARATAAGETIDVATLDRALEATGMTPEQFDALVSRCRPRGEDRVLLAAAAAAEAKLPKLGRQIDEARAIRDRLFEQHDAPIRQMVAEHNTLLNATVAGSIAREALYRDVPGGAGIELAEADTEWRRAETERSQLERDAGEGKKEAEHYDAIAEQQEQKRPQHGWVDEDNRSAARSAKRRADAAAAALPAATAAAQAARDRLREAQARALES